MRVWDKGLTESDGCREGDCESVEEKQNIKGSREILSSGWDPRVSSGRDSEGPGENILSGIFFKKKKEKHDNKLALSRLLANTAPVWWGRSHRNGGGCYLAWMHASSRRGDSRRPSFLPFHSSSADDRLCWWWVFLGFRWGGQPTPGRAPGRHHYPFVFEADATTPAKMTGYLRT